MSIRFRGIGFTSVAVFAMLVGGCQTTDPGASKAGPGSGRTVLRVATFDAAGEPSAAMISEFTRQVERLSKGTLKVEPAFRAAGVGGLDEEPVAKKVAGGEFELGLIASRGFDRAGVTSLRALTAPFLITSDGLLAAVLTGGLDGKLMSGLPSFGVSGLALFPEGLRHPFAFRTPLRSPADFKNARLRAPASRAT